MKQDREPLPRDLELARASDRLAESLGLRWIDAPPEGYSDGADARDAGAWRATFSELRFVAETDDGEALALWRFEPGVSLATAPIVGLDSEGQLSCRGASFADALVAIAPDPGEVVALYRENGVDVASTPEVVRARARFLPNPDARHRRRESGTREVLVERTAEPSTVEDLVGMSARDPRVAVMLAGIEENERPLELWTDGDGRLSVLYLEPGRLKIPVPVRGIPLGASESALAALGPASRRGEVSTHRWATWDQSGVRMHVEVSEGLVSRITLSAIEVLPAHLR
jgi:hypothetical protein